MNQREFDKLSLEKKVEVVNRRGIYMDNRTLFWQFYIELFKIDDFYVEKFFDVNAIKLLQIVLIPEEDILHRYISLSDLYYSNLNITPPPIN